MNENNVVINEETPSEVSETTSNVDTTTEDYVEAETTNTTDDTVEDETTVSDTPVVNEVTDVETPEVVEFTEEDVEFGLPNKRLFPLNNKDNVLKAIRKFHTCGTIPDRKRLAKNIVTACEKFNITLLEGSYIHQYLD